MKRKKLILLTSEFPYGAGETFLETEIQFLAQEFDEVLIFSAASSTRDIREVPKNVSCELFSKRISNLDKLKALAGIFSSELKKEKQRVLKTYQKSWSSGIRNTALISLFLGKRWKKHLTKHLSDSQNFDIAFYSYWCAETAIGLALLRQENPSIRAFSRVHGWDLYFEANAFNYQPFRELIASNLSKLFPISDKGKRYIEEYWKVKSDSVEVARLGTREMTHTSIRPKQNVLVSCSNMIPLKRVQLIAESLKFVEGIELDWVHFGDGPERAKVEEVVKSLNGSSISVQLKGHQSNSEVLKWFGENAPSLFVNASTTEGIPVSIMEAMSFGTPVFATNVGGTSEIVNSENGELLKVDISASDLGKKIQSFFELSEEEQRSIRNAACKTWNDSYNASVNYTLFAKEKLS